MKLLIFACALGYSKCIDDKPLVRSISKISIFTLDLKYLTLYNKTNTYNSHLLFM